eukprot:SAG25_NODE_247_length_11077_cov_5.635088_5_plen_185_part_00
MAAAAAPRDPEKFRWVPRGAAEPLLPPPDPAHTLFVFDFDCTLSSLHLFKVLRSYQGQQDLVRDPNAFFDRCAIMSRFCHLRRRRSRQCLCPPHVACCHGCARTDAGKLPLLVHFGWPPRMNRTLIIASSSCCCCCCCCYSSSSEFSVAQSASPRSSSSCARCVSSRARCGCFPSAMKARSLPP